MTLVPPGPVLVVTDPDAIGGHDQQLLAWAQRTGRIRTHVGLQHLFVLHDDRCARVAGRGACDCKPHIRFGLNLVKWEEPPMERRGSPPRRQLYAGA